ncbi:aminoacyl-histidine dipeptidase [bacterium]|nr:aminoacyl-histidine dipeptidase [candidate division CSSED10-310 bacterium]
MGVLSNLEPRHVWEHFENMCNIPHPSRQEEGIAQYIIERAKRYGYATRRDQVGNVIVEIPGTPGLESKPIVVLQGHMDMVPVAAPGVTHDFSKDPIRPRIDGEYVKATGTTLGADNGIGGALMLGIMDDSSVKHGPLELFFTVNEESGMDGAHGTEAEFVKGRILINLDTEEFGQYYISCAGGGDSVITLPIHRGTAPCTCKSGSLRIKVSGLRGGHSGIDINIGIASGNKILARLLDAAWDAGVFQLKSIRGGNKRNSISDGAEAVICLEHSDAAMIRRVLMAMTEIIREEFAKTEPGFTVEITDVEDASPCLDKESTEAVIRLLIALPHGVITMSPEVPGLVETSTNLGVMESMDSVVKITMLTRSAVTSHLIAVKKQIRTIAVLAGASVEEPRGYPGWKPDMDSPLLKIAMKVYETKYGSAPEVKAIHAGLECGLFSEKLPGVDMLSIGPEMHFVHSPNEELNIASVPKSYDLLGDLLKAIAEQY